MQPKMTIAEVEAFIADAFPQAAALYRIEEMGPMSGRVVMTPSDENLRPGGTISGPTLFGLADCAVYYTILAMIGPEALTVTTNASIDFMRKPQIGADIVADVTLLKLGRSLAVGDVRMTSRDHDDVVARATFTYSIPPKK